jgi:hypothetical protein
VADLKLNGFCILIDMLTDKNDAMNVVFSFLGVADIALAVE